MFEDSEETCPVRWVRDGDLVAAALPPSQVYWLGRHLRSFHEALDHDSRVAVRLGDPARTAETIDVMLTALSPDGGSIVLRSPSDVWAWIWGLHEFGLSLPVRLGVGQPPCRGREPAGGTRRHRLLDRMLTWLFLLIDELITVAGLPDQSLLGGPED
jgi:hypothetical protein